MKFIDLLPPFYDTCPVTNNLQDALTNEFDNLVSKYNDTLNQTYVGSATWALSDWEKLVGVQNLTGTIEERRARVMAKLKAKGTTTKAVIESIAKDYCDKATVTEHFSDYTFVVNLDSNNESEYPIILHVAELDVSIWEVKPAHLDHKVNMRHGRVLNIHTSYDDVKFKYIPCNAIYAGATQPNTYFKESELVILPPYSTGGAEDVAVLGTGVVGQMILGTGGSHDN